MEQKILIIEQSQLNLDLIGKLKGKEFKNHIDLNLFAN